MLGTQYYGITNCYPLQQLNNWAFVVLFGAQFQAVSGELISFCCESIQENYNTPVVEHTRSAMPPFARYGKESLKIACW